jgi:hypothetical protein
MRHGGHITRCPLEHWREHVATQFDWRAEECEAGGGSDLYGDDQKSATAQTWRNAARKVPGHGDAAPPP